ncbi:MAG: DNA replication/repair protein RecF [Gammaproteobacteria bacterium]|nr:DNA replication/repair protein RecF [Gammaproteobacteria bacterium]
MALETLSIHNLRNIKQMDIQLSPGVNVLFGDNGSGKTSILEAAYLLSTGRSFRTNLQRSVIRDGEAKTTVFGSCNFSQGLHNNTLGVSLGNSGSEFRVNGCGVNNRAELAKALPLLVVTPSSHELLDGGPHHRRRFLDWGVFHVEHSYGKTWSMFKKAIRHRNALLIKGLRNKQDADLLASLDVELGRLGTGVTELRESYFSSLVPFINTLCSSLFEDMDLNVQLRSGVSQELSFVEYLKSGLEQDLKRGRTMQGPHVADIRIKVGKHDAKEVLSRGQQKLLVYALLVSQIIHFRSVSGKESILALDDVSSELDEKSFDQLLDVLLAQKTQLLITSVKKEDLRLDRFLDSSMFHVKHGTISSIKN